MNAHQARPPQQKSYTLPPKVTSCREALGSDGVSYTFHHEEWGELGRLEVVAHGLQSKITAYDIQGDSRDSLTPLRNDLFRKIAMELSQELEKKCGKGKTLQASQISNFSSNHRVIESKALVCLTCNAPVALLIFAPDAHTQGQLEDYARVMYSQIVDLNLPTWIIGAEEELVPDIEGIALILEIWPERKKAKKISHLKFNPMLDQIQNTHCRLAQN